PSSESKVESSVIGAFVQIYTFAPPYPASFPVADWTLPGDTVLHSHGIIQARFPEIVFPHCCGSTSSPIYGSTSGGTSPTAVGPLCPTTSLTRPLSSFRARDCRTRIRRLYWVPIHLASSVRYVGGADLLDGARLTVDMPPSGTVDKRDIIWTAQ